MKVLDLSHHPQDVRSGGWVDLSRFGNHGVPHGGARPYMIAPGVMGFKFNAVDAYVEMSNSADEITSDISIGVWFRRDGDSGGSSVSNYHGIVRGITGNYYYPRVLVETNGASIWFQFRSGGETKTLKALETSFELYKYRYIAVSKGSFGSRLYLDANLVKEDDTMTGTIDTGSGVLLIGCGGTPLQHYMANGVTANLVIENRAWSEAEVRENMYRSPVYRMLRGLPHSQVYIKVPWKQQGGIYVL